MIFIMVMSFALPLGKVSAQELLLDQMQSAAGLKLFPVYGKEKSFYYMPDKVEIPNGSDGKKQFSFLKFVNDDEGAGEGGIQKVDGGGLVTFLINFAVPNQTIQRAQSELQRKVPGAQIIGPLNYREGTFALVSEFLQEDGDWSKRVLGLGKAPVMEGHKAAVSIRLTKKGAIILWESFQQAASNINVSFEMIIGGYRNPYEAKMTAWWEKVAKNRSLNIGARTDFLGVDVQDVMKELKESGAIEIEVKGEDAKMDRLWEMAYGKLAAQMFEPANDPITLATLQDDPNVYSNFDRANQFNTQVRQRITRENQAELAREEGERQRLLAFAEQWQLLGDIARSTGQSNTAGTASTSNNTTSNPTNNRPPATANNTTGSAGSNTASTASNRPAQGAAPRVRAANLQTPPSFSLMASYRKKQFKKTGKFELNFKKWTADTQSMRFDENIGGFGKRMFNDPAHFRVINLDDPAYKVRELVVRLDGQNSEDFDKFVNSVLVSVTKTHQDGFVHVDEIEINRSNFNKSGNNFNMTYGFHGDTDRAKWLDYQYKVVWKLFGGAEWSSGWQESNEFIIDVSPPHKYREVTVEADPDVFTAESVRLATINFKSTLFGKPSVQQVTLKPGSSGVLSKVIKYAHEPNDYGYQYDISWVKRGSIQLNQNDLNGNAEFIFADELP